MSILDTILWPIYFFITFFGLFLIETYDFFIWLIFIIFTARYSYKKWKWKGLFLGLLISVFWWVPYGLYEYLYQSKRMEFLCTEDLKFKVYVSPEEWKEAVIWDKILNNYRKNFKYKNNYYLAPDEIDFNNTKYRLSYEPDNTERVFRYYAYEENGKITIYKKSYYDVFLKKILFSYAHMIYIEDFILFDGPVLYELSHLWGYKIDHHDACRKTYIPDFFKNYERH